MPLARAIIADFQHGSLEVEQEILKDLATVESLDVHHRGAAVGPGRGCRRDHGLSHAQGDPGHDRAAETLQADRPLRRRLRQRRSRVRPQPRHSRGQRARLRHRGSRRLGHRHDAGADPRHRAAEHVSAARPTPTGDTTTSRRCYRLRGPDVRDHRPGADRHRGGPAGQGPRHGRRLLRSLQARRLRQGPRRAPGRDARRAAGPGVRAELPLPAHARNAPHRSTPPRSSKCRAART